MRPDRWRSGCSSAGDIAGHKIGRAVRFDPVEILELTRRPGRRLARPRLSLEDRSENPDETQEATAMPLNSEERSTGWEAGSGAPAGSTRTASAVGKAASERSPRPASG